MKKETLKERVEELEAQVRWLSWLMDKHIYDDNPKYYFYPAKIQPDSTKGWTLP